MIVFSVPGKPAGKERPRFAKSGAVYTPTKTKEMEMLIAAYYRAAGGRNLGAVPVGIVIEMVYGIPKRGTKEELAKIRAGKRVPMSKPDCDNCAKLVCDALNGVAYDDDRQITQIGVFKRFCRDNEQPHVEVRVWESESQPC